MGTGIQLLRELGAGGHRNLNHYYYDGTRKRKRRKVEYKCSGNWELETIRTGL